MTMQLPRTLAPSERFDALYRQHRRAVWSYCRAILGDEAEAEDATEETFARLWRSLSGPGDPDHDLPWVKTVARNYCYDVLRKRMRVQLSDESSLEREASTADAAEELALGKLEHALVRDSLAHVAPAYRSILELREGLGLSYQEIAEHEAIPLAAVESRLYRARRALRRSFLSLTGAQSFAGYLAWRVRVRFGSLGLAGAATSPLAGPVVHASTPSATSAIATAAVATLATIGAVGLDGHQLAPAPAQLQPAATAAPRLGPVARTSVPAGHITAIHAGATAHRPLALRVPHLRPANRLEGAVLGEGFDAAVSAGTYSSGGSSPAAPGAIGPGVLQSAPSGASTGSASQPGALSGDTGLNASSTTLSSSASEPGSNTSTTPGQVANWSSAPIGWGAVPPPATATPQGITPAAGAMASRDAAASLDATGVASQAAPAPKDTVDAHQGSGARRAATTGWSPGHRQAPAILVGAPAWSAPDASSSAFANDRSLTPASSALGSTTLATNPETSAVPPGAPMPDGVPAASSPADPNGVVSTSGDPTGAGTSVTGLSVQGASGGPGSPTNDPSTTTGSSAQLGAGQDTTSGRWSPGGGWTSGRPSDAARWTFWR